jgi:predicted transcriptional regulator
MVLIYQSRGRAFRYCEVMESLVRETRIRLCLSVEDLAEMLGVSATSVADLERDEAAGSASTGSVLQALKTMIQKAAAFAIDQSRITRAEQAAHQLSEAVKTTMELEGQTAPRTWLRSSMREP